MTSHLTKASGVLGLRALAVPELLRAVLGYVGDGMDVVLLLTCKELHNYVRRFRRRVRSVRHLESLMSTFLVTPSLAKWGVDALGMAMSYDTTRLAVKLGYVETLKWLLKRGAEFHRSLACQYAASTGQLAMLQYLRSSLQPPCPWDESTSYSAALNGHLHILRWLRAAQPEPCPWDERVTTTSAQQGNLEIFQFARSAPKPCPWDTDTALYAAANGHRAVLQWARQQTPPCPWCPMSCAYVAKRGDLLLLQWMRRPEDPCAWSALTCAYAAQNGHLEVLQWARAQEPPCRWDRRVTSLAATNGHLEVLQWARSQVPSCPWDVPGILVNRATPPAVREWILAQPNIA